MAKCEQCKHNGECLAISDQCTRFEPEIPFIKIRNLAKWMDESKMRAEFTDYESPIKVVMAEMATKFDGDVLTAVQRYGIDVNREELLKALQYDRDQFEAGFKAGLAKADRPHAHWIIYPEMNEDRYCSKCDMDFENDGLTFNFCPHCGAQMDGGDEND